MSEDIWHFPRTSLAEQVVGMIEVGLANALIFFAPRRKGKTEFLLKDIQPFAEKKNIITFYFSFQVCFSMLGDVKYNLDCFVNSY